MFYQAGRLSFLPAILSLFIFPVYAQEKNEQPAALVRYTEVIEHTVRKTIQLPGVVEARTSSLVATEIEGLVMELMVREGDRVNKDQKLAGLRTTALKLRLNAARAQLREAKSRHKLAQRSLVRAQELYDSKFIPEQQLDESFYESDAWQGRIENLSAEIAMIEYDIEQSIIRAPFSGVITERHIEVGEWRESGEPVFRMVSMQDLEVHVDVPERYYSNLSQKDEVQISFDSLPGRYFATLVRAIIPSADAQAHTFPVKLKILEPDPAIGIGMLVRVSLPIGGSYTGLLIPKDAIVRKGPDELVYRMKADNTVEAVTVNSTMGFGEWVVVEGDIQKGNRVITRGNERLMPGQQVSGQLQDYPVP